MSFKVSRISTRCILCCADGAPQAPHHYSKNLKMRLSLSQCILQAFLTSPVTFLTATTITLRHSVINYIVCYFCFRDELNLLSPDARVVSYRLPITYDLNVNKLSRLKRERLSNLSPLARFSKIILTQLRCTSQMWTGNNIRDSVEASLHKMAVRNTYTPWPSYTNIPPLTGLNSIYHWNWLLRFLTRL